MFTGVDIVVGPVVGIVTQTSATVLLEVSAATEVSVSLYLLSKMSTEGRYCSKQSFAIDAFEPKALILTGLSPGCHYAAYIGGVKPSGSPM